jgi:hypothetical protein
MFNFTKIDEGYVGRSMYGPVEVRPYYESIW